MNRLLAGVVTVALLWTGACADSSSDEGESVVVGDESDRLPVVVDTDGGSDDAIALLYLLQHPAVEVEAITVSGTGLVHCDSGVANAAGLVELAAPDSDVPIGCGSSEPLEGDRRFPAEWRAQADGRYGGILPAGEVLAAPPTAVELLTSTIAGAERPVTVLTLGPLTNLAEALAATPEIAEMIERVVVMGGALGVPGNVQLEDEPAAAAAEWNIYVDPTAAKAVLDGPVPVTLVPLDSQVPVDSYVVRALADGATSEPARTIAELLQSSPFFVSGDFFLWDPVAAAAAADPDAFLLRPRRASVVTDGPNAGQTVPGRGREITMATLVGSDEFLTSFLGTLDGRESGISISRVPDTQVTVASDTVRLTETTIEAGPSVIGIGTNGVAAVGTIEPGYTDADINAFLARNPSEPPPWFDPVAIFQSIDGRPSGTFVDLEPGELTVVGISTDTPTPTVTGRAVLTVAPPGRAAPEG